MIVRDLDERLNQQLQRRADRLGRTREEDTRTILHTALRDGRPPGNLADLAMEIFAADGVALDPNPLLRYPLSLTWAHDRSRHQRRFRGHARHV